MNDYNVAGNGAILGQTLRWLRKLFGRGISLLSDGIAEGVFLLSLTFPSFLPITDGPIESNV